MAVAARNEPVPGEVSTEDEVHGELSASACHDPDDSSQYQNIRSILQSQRKLCTSACFEGIVNTVDPVIDDAEALFKEKDYRKSLDKYIIAVKYIMDVLLAWEGSAEDKLVVRKTAEALMSRAEDIKRYCPQQISDYESKYFNMLEAEMTRDVAASGYDSFCGSQTVKEFLKEHVVLPLKFPDLFRGRRWPCPVLLYGHPGTGKSRLLEMSAHEAEVKLFVFNMYLVGSQMFGAAKYADQLIKTVFQVAYKNAPCILCLEDLDALTGGDEVSRKAKTELLCQVQALTADQKHQVILIGVTQKPWKLEATLRRRFVPRRCVELPTTQARIDMVNMWLRDQTHDLNPEDITEIGRRTEGFTGADMLVMVRGASMTRVRKMAKAEYFKKILVPADQCRKRRADSESDSESEEPAADPSSEDNKAVSNSSGALEASGNLVMGQKDTKNMDDLNHGRGEDEEQSDDLVSHVTSGQESDLPEITGGGREQSNLPETSKDDGVEMVEKFTPCEPSEEGAVKATLFDFPGKKLWLYPDITKEAMMESLTESRSSVTDEDIAHMISFRENFEN